MPSRMPGSSPHVRGAPGVRGVRHLLSGIIPACAGSTGRGFSCFLQAWDHPRMCGEHHVKDIVQDTKWGSSPHVRGAPDAVCRELRGGGIIPACAGSTKPIRSRHTRRWGSSPHVRGAQSARWASASPSGIIPACAGSTFHTAILDVAERDHPRMCGEHITGNADDAVKAGSSPHVRGAHSVTCACLPTLGIIPACAGSTHCFPSSRY